MLVVETPLTFSKLRKKSSHSERTVLLFIQDPTNGTFDIKM
jgi:hypothetical protein